MKKKTFRTRLSYEQRDKSTKAQRIANNICEKKLLKKR